MVQVLMVAAVVVFIIVIGKHEWQIRRINRNASWVLSEAQKKAPPAEAEGKMEYGGVKLP
jgi:hypothetical protein